MRYSWLFLILHWGLSPRIDSGDAGNRASFLGYYDEVRLSNAVLTPEMFLKFKSGKGTVLLVR